MNVIYIIRIGLGALAALAATLLVDLKVGNPLINGITVALAVYLLTYYLLKMVFANKVEKPTKILTMGYGVYALTFIFFWILFITPFLAPPVAQFTVSPEQPIVGEAIIFTSVGEDPDGEILRYSWNFGDGNSIKEEDPIITHTYSEAGEYTVQLTVVDDHGITSKNTTTITVLAPS